MGRKGPERHHEAARVGGAEADRAQPVAALRSGARIAIHAIRPASRKDRRDRVATGARPPATGSDLPGDRRPGRNRMRGGGVAGRPWRGDDRAQWTPGTGCGRGGNDPHAARARGEPGRGAGGRDGHPGDRSDARAHRPGPASPGGGDSQRGSAVGRRADQPELGEVRECPLAEDSGRLAPASRDRASRPRPLHSLLEPRRGDGQSGTGESRRGQRLPRSARRPPPRDGTPGTGHCMGGMVRDRRGGGAEGPDRKAAFGAGRPLVHPAAGPEGDGTAGAPGCDDIRGDVDGLERLRRGGRGTPPLPGRSPLGGRGVRRRPRDFFGRRGDPAAGNAGVGARKPSGLVPAGGGAGRAPPAFDAGPLGRVLRPRHGLAHGGGAPEPVESGLRGGLHRVQYGGVRLPGYRFAGPARGRGVGRGRSGARSADSGRTDPGRTGVPSGAATGRGWHRDRRHGVPLPRRAGSRRLLAVARGGAQRGDGRASGPRRRG